MNLFPDFSSLLHQYRKEEIIRIFKGSLDNRFENALELGAGDGFQSELLVRYTKNLISIDINPHKLLLENSKFIKYKICDAEEIGSIFNKNQFDLIFSSNLLEHLPDPEKTLNSVYDLLKKGGITIHIIPNFFFKLTHLLLLIPKLILEFLKSLQVEYGFLNSMKFLIGAKREQILQEKKIYNDNLKIYRQIKPHVYRLIIPEPHGVSSNNLNEFFAFSKKRWKKLFKKSKLELLIIMKGPVFSAYGFGFKTLRKILSRLEFSSEYVYIAIKK